MNKKVIIIGASSGIGKALALLYLNAGCQVGITGRRKELLEEIQEQYPNQVYVESFDVQADNAAEHVESLIRKMGGMDLLIYNSGYGDVSNELNWEIEKRTYETNVKGFIIIVHKAFNYFVAQGYGQLAAISSVAALRGNSQAPGYSASKAFMSTYMEGLHMKALKLRTPNGERIPISVTDILPGFIATKPAKANTVFWIAPVEKAVRQMYHVIEKRKRRAYVPRRWALIAWVLKWVPFFVFRKIV